MPLDVSAYNYISHQYIYLHQLLWIGLQYAQQMQAYLRSMVIE